MNDFVFDFHLNENYKIITEIGVYCKGTPYIGTYYSSFKIIIFDYFQQQ